METKVFAQALFCLAVAGFWTTGSSQRRSGGRFQQEDTCPDLVGCLNEFDRLLQQCESNAISNERQNQRLQRILQASQCNTDFQQLKSQKRIYQAQRKQFMSNCTGLSVQPSNRQFCVSSGSFVHRTPQQCMREARSCRKECMNYKRGCLRAAVCHEEYETGVKNALHDQIHRINLQILQGQECLQRRIAEDPSAFRSSNGGGNWQDIALTINRDLPGHEELFL